MARAGIFASGRAVVASAEPMAFQAFRTDSVDRATYTFTAVPLGTEAANRLVVVAATYRTNPNVSAVTAGGVSLTKDASAASAQLHKVDLWSGVVPTGTTGDIVVSFGGIVSNRLGIGVWSGNGVAFTGNTVSAITDDPVTMNLTTTPGQFVIGVVSSRHTTGTAAPWVSWTTARSRADVSTDGQIAVMGLADIVATGTTTDMSSTLVNAQGDNPGRLAASYA